MNLNYLVSVAGGVLCFCTCCSCSHAMNDRFNGKSNREINDSLYDLHSEEDRKSAIDQVTKNGKKDGGLALLNQLKHVALKGTGTAGGPGANPPGTDPLIKLMQANTPLTDDDLDIIADYKGDTVQAADQTKTLVTVGADGSSAKPASSVNKATATTKGTWFKLYRNSDGALLCRFRLKSNWPATADDASLKKLIFEWEVVTTGGIVTNVGEVPAIASVLQGL